MTPNDVDQAYDEAKGIRWVTRDGKCMTIEEMSDRHLDNAIRMLERRIKLGGSDEYPLWRDELYLSACQLVQYGREVERDFAQGRNRNLQSLSRDHGRNEE